MIFALFIALVVTGLIIFSQFGSQPNVATPKAQVYAANMAVWHQAAMLEMNDSSFISPGTCSPGTSCPWPLNISLLDKTTNKPINLLSSNWPEYTPMVAESPTSGWQSFLLQNINGLTGNIGSDNYMLTVFRGFGGGSVAGVETSLGNQDASNFSNGLANTVTERSGLGILNCDTSGVANPKCTFSRYSSATDPGTGNTDKPLVFDSSLLAAASVKDLNNNPYFPSGSPARDLNGKMAIMTRVGGLVVDCLSGPINLVQTSPPKISSGIFPPSADVNLTRTIKGNLIAVFIGTNAGAAGNITDDQGNTYTQLQQEPGFAPFYYLTKNPGGIQTIHITGATGTSFGVIVREYSGVCNFDVSKVGITPTSPPSVGPITTTHPNELIVSSIFENTSPFTATSATGYNNSVSVLLPSGAGLGVVDNQSAAPGSYSITWPAYTNAWGSSLVAFY